MTTGTVALGLDISMYGRVGRYDTIFSRIRSIQGDRPRTCRPEGRSTDGLPTATVNAAAGNDWVGGLEGSGGIAQRDSSAFSMVTILV